MLLSPFRCSWIGEDITGKIEKISQTFVGWVVTGAVPLAPGNDQSPVAKDSEVLRNTWLALAETLVEIRDTGLAVE